MRCCNAKRSTYEPQKRLKLCVQYIVGRAEKEKCYEETFSLMSKVSQQAHTSMKKTVAQLATAAELRQSFS